MMMTGMRQICPTPRGGASLIPGTGYLRRGDMYKIVLMACIRKFPNIIHLAGGAIQILVDVL